MYNWQIGMISIDVDENEEGQQVHEDSCGGYCCDEQEEDSSGYYSSYHSVDLVSSSGGSCVGGSQALNRELKTGRNEFGLLLVYGKRIEPVLKAYKGSKEGIFIFI